jgi:hypothetical protein
LVKAPLEWAAGKACVNLNLVQKLTDRALMRTTAVYADASGEEAVAFAAGLRGTLEGTSVALRLVVTAAFLDLHTNQLSSPGGPR